MKTTLEAANKSRDTQLIDYLIIQSNEHNYVDTNKFRIILFVVFASS